MNNLSKEHELSSRMAGKVKEKIFFIVTNGFDHAMNLVGTLVLAETIFDCVLKSFCEIRNKPT